MNFAAILPIHIAAAMSAETVFEALGIICEAAEFTPQHRPEIRELVWSSTSLPVRHGWIMAWIAKEWNA